jgi:pimeloyl-ACP methyl ester carboxylesterase
MKLHTLRLPGAGLTIAADAAGPEDGPLIMLMHGGGQTRHSWGGALRALAASGHYAVSLDLRGHGDSDWAPDGAYSVADFAADAVSVARFLGRPPVLVGASLGGLASLLIAGEAMTEIRGLILVDVAPKIEVEGASRIGEFMRANPEGFATVEEAADAVAAYIPHRPRPKDVSGLKKNLRLREDGRWRWHWDPNFLQDRSLDPARGEERLRDAARALTTPTLLIRGGRSEVVSEEGARDFLQLAPHAEFVDVAGADHMVAGDKNDVFNAAVLDFIARRIDRLTESSSDAATAG